MKTAREAYAEHIAMWGDGNCSNALDYRPMIESFGEICAQADSGEYQGDTLLLYKLSDGEYGYLSFGWGSCSGCDALRARNTFDEVQTFMDSLRSGIVVIGRDISDVEQFLLTHDWDGEWIDGRLRDEFVDACQKYIAKEAD